MAVLVASEHHRHAVGAAGTWPFVGRDSELARVGELFHAGKSGVVLVGEPGAGKTRLGLECLQVVASMGAAVVRCTGCRATAELPFGAFFGVLRVPQDGNAATADRAALLRRCRDELVAGAGGRRPAILVDDAHLLDGHSIALVEQLARSGDAFVVLTVDEDLAGTPFLVSLWQGGPLERLGVESLTVEQVEALISEVLGGAADWATVRRLAHASDGKPLFLRELLLGAYDDGTLRSDFGVWRLTGSLPTSRRLTELVSARLSGLRADERYLLELIALGEPLAVDDFPDLDVKSLHGLEKRSVIVSEDHRGRVVLRLAYSAYGLVLRSQISPLRTQQIALQLADALDTAGRHDPDDLLRIASWRLAGGAPRADLMIEAAQVARGRHDFGLAERLAARAVELAPTFDARLLLAQLNAVLGRHEQAESQLDQLFCSAGTDAQRARVAVTRMENLVFNFGRLDRGHALAAEAEALVADEEWRNELAGKRASVVAGTSGPRSAVEIAVPLLERAEGRAFVWGSMVAAYALGRVGQFHKARETAGRGRAAHLAMAEQLEWSPWRHDFFETLVVAHEGGLDESHERALQLYRDAVEQGSTEAQAWFAWKLSMHVADRGSPRSAAQYAGLAASLFWELGRLQRYQFALTQLTIALAIAGSVEEARSARQLARSLGLPESRYFPADRLQADGWVAVATRDAALAVRRFQEASDVAREMGDAVGEAESLHALARLGELKGVRKRMETLAADVEGRLMSARFDHVSAIEREDPRMLENVAAEFRRIGARLLAAEASARAAREWRRGGHARRSAAAELQTLERLRECERPYGAAMLTSTASVRLTHAELRTAEQALTGRPSRQIANELAISVRTVENQLQRVYQKLGIGGRDELGEALGKYLGVSELSAHD